MSVSKRKQRFDGPVSHAPVDWRIEETW